MIKWPILSLLFMLGAMGCNKEKPEAAVPQTSGQIEIPADAVTTASGLQYTDKKVGDGAIPAKGQTIVVHYTGWLLSGLKFDSSVDRAEPLEFTIGVGQVIAGWDEGLSTMRVGGSRRLYIPYQLAYGENGAGPIPPKATLVFDVELLQIK
jgi:peptidylprolyl isomerase